MLNRFGVAGLAQMVERVICNHDVAGSIPATGTRGALQAPEMRANNWPTVVLLASRSSTSMSSPGVSELESHLQRISSLATPLKIANLVSCGKPFVWPRQRR